MTALEALYVITPALAASYGVGLFHGAGFITMKGSSSGGDHSRVRHYAKALAGGSESRPGMVSTATNDPSETA